MISKELFTNRFQYLIDCYEKKWDDNYKQVKAKIYYEQLKNYSEIAFRKGVESAVREGKYFPTVADLIEKCNVCRGRNKEVVQDHHFENPYEDNKTILDKFYNSPECDRNKIKSLAFKLMKRKGVIADDYKKGANEWHDNVIKVVFNNSFKYIVLRVYYRKEVMALGYDFKGEVHSTKGWLDFDEVELEEDDK